MSKNVFKYLNNDSTIWVDLHNLKYERVHPWNMRIPPKCSWFFRILCKTMDLIKPYIWINSVNVNTVSFLKDSRCFDTPLYYKPSYLNMDLDLDNIHISEITDNSTWNFESLKIDFGNFLNSPILDKDKGLVDPNVESN